MISLPGYDAWKTRAPDWDDPDEDACPTCHGTGQEWLSPCYYRCSACGGSGEWEPEMFPLDGDEDDFFGAGLDD